MDTIDRAADVMDPACPSRVVLRRMGERWTPLVIEALAGGPLRFVELRKAVGTLTPKVLTQTLRSLERDGLLTRTVHAQVPPRVDYELTDLGRSLTAPVQAMRRWAEHNVDAVVAAQERYDAR
ncbi:winged helix-turn-helix transcriptional regulator [Calidifontibacter terrae]